MGLHLEQPFRCLYIGVTSGLSGRAWEHKTGVLEGFTKKYKINQLVYYEFFHDIESAISRENQLKGWSRAKKNRPRSEDESWMERSPASRYNVGPSARLAQP